MAGYWGSTYWSSRYWGATYWGGVANVSTGKYWAPSYWPIHYWNANYWGGGTAPPAGGYWANKYWPTGFWNAHYWRPSSSTTPATSGKYWAPGFWHTHYWANGYWNPGTSNAPSHIDSTLDGVGASFRGTFTPLTNTFGNLAAQLDGVSGPLIGSSAYRLIFDLNVAIAPLWLAQEFPIYTSALATTLDSVGGSLLGTFVAQNAYNGPLRSTLNDVQGALSGTHTAPASRAGAIISQLDDISGLLSGSSFNAPFIGPLAGNLDGVVGQFIGSAAVPVFSGPLSITLDGTTAALQGISVSSDATVGEFQSSLDGVSSLMEAVSDIGGVPRLALEAAVVVSAFESEPDPAVLEITP